MLLQYYAGYLMLSVSSSLLVRLSFLLSLLTPASHFACVCSLALPPDMCTRIFLVSRVDGSSVMPALSSTRMRYLHDGDAGHQMTCLNSEGFSVKYEVPPKFLGR